MKIIRSHPTTLQNLIEHIANSMNVTYQYAFGEYNLTIPKTIGSGNIKALFLENGIGVLNFDCLFKENFHLRLDKTIAGLFQFLYIYKGKVEYSLGTNSESYFLDQYQSFLCANPSKDLQLTFQSEKHVNLLLLECDTEELERKINYDSATDKFQLNQIVGGLNSTNDLICNRSYNLQISECIKDICEFKHDLFLRRLFIESNIYKIITLLLIECISDHSKPKAMFRKSEIDAIERAASLIRNDISVIRTIDEIALEVGLNTNKLQQGFRDFYNVTVNNYINRIRLRKAADLLSNTNLSMSEIAESIGLSSQSYFTQKFKKEYNLTPYRFRIKKRN